MKTPDSRVEDSPPSPSDTNQTRSRATWGGRLWKVAMGLLLVLVGSIFVQYMWNSYRRASIMDDWEQGQAVVTSSAIVDGGLNQRGLPKYLLEVHYEFRHDGGDLSSNRVKRLPVESGDKKKLNRRHARYKVGAAVPCYFPPHDPAQVVLEKDSKGALYSIWFPILFIVGGLGMIVSALFLSRGKST